MFRNWYNQFVVVVYLIVNKIYGIKYKAAFGIQAFNLFI